MGARLNWSWELEAQPCRTITESRLNQEIVTRDEKQRSKARDAFVISRIR